MHTTLRQLETLKCFCLTRSITETARLTHVSQPAVSQTLRELEGQFGFALYTRIGNRLQITAECMQLLPEIDRIMANYGTLQGRVSELRDTRAGSVSIITPPTFSIDLIPRAIKAFRQSRPNLAVHLEVSTEAMTERKVRDEVFDLGIGFYPPNDINIAFQPIIETEIICVMHRSHPLAGAPVLDLRALDKHMLVTVIHEGNVISRVHQAVSDRFEAGQIISTNQSIAAFNLVRQGGMIALLHPMAVPETALPILHIARFEPRIGVDIALSYSRRRPVSRTTAKFMLALRDSARVKAEILADAGIPFKVVM